MLVLALLVVHSRLVCAASPSIGQERRGYLRTLEDVQQQLDAKSAALTRLKDSATRAKRAHAKEVAGMRQQLSELRETVAVFKSRERNAELQLNDRRSKEVELRERLAATEEQVRAVAAWLCCVVSGHIQWSGPYKWPVVCMWWCRC